MTIIFVLYADFVALISPRLLVRQCSSRFVLEESRYKLDLLRVAISCLSQVIPSPPAMEPDQSKILSTPNKVLRTKSQVLMETWGTDDDFSDMSRIQKHFDAPAPPIETWTKLELPYQAPSCPPLLSYEQILDGLKKHKLDQNFGSHHLFRYGDAVVKCSTSPSIVEVIMLLKLSFSNQSNDSRIIGSRESTFPCGETSSTEDPHSACRVGGRR